MEYYSAIKKGSFAICDKMMDLEGIMLSKIGHTEKDNYHMISYMWNPKKRKETPTMKNNLDSQKQRTKLVVARGKVGVGE